MKNSRKIFAVSGARSDYDLLFSVYKKLDEDPDIDFKIIITGPNLSDTYGYTAQYIEKDGFTIVGKIFNLIDSSQKIGRILSIGAQIPSIAHVLEQEKPDIVMVAGDREEAISVSMTCAYMDIPVAHFFGGDIAKDGNIDNSVRYATSKFAHLHFPTLEEHKQTLLKLGEDEWRIHVMGNPALDRIVNSPMLSKQEVLGNLGAESKKISNYCVLIQHPIITQVKQQKEHIRITLDSLLENYEGHCFINFPNSDAGSNAIIQEYQEYAKNHPNKFSLFQNLNRVDYLSLLNNGDFLIGNSSSGVIEVASLGLPAINVGERQRGRRHGNNVIFVDNDKVQIENAIKKVINDEDFRAEIAKRENPYGDGNSAPKVLEVLKTVDLDDNLIYKNITY